MTDVQVLNYGGGTQTIAMCLLVAHGALPRPDYIVMADTGREVASTFAYLDTYVRSLLAAHGLAVAIAGHDLATVDLHALNGDLLLPAFTDTGKLPTFCSSEWKARVVRRYLRSQGVTGATNWIGFTLEERGRVKDHGRAPWLKSYPLLDLCLTRHDCEQIITRQGWPLPRKSRCYMCPHQSNAEWRELRDTKPDEFAAAVALDEEIRAADDFGAVYLHPARQPLRVVNLDAEDRREPARQCGLGTCWI